MKYRIFIALVLSFLLTFAFSSLILAQDPVTPPTTLSAVNGQTLWIDNCAPCHGISGNGDGPTASSLGFAPSNFADATAAKNRSLAYMFDVAKNGRMDKMMPPWKNSLNDSQIWDAVAYAASLGTTDADIAAGEVIYTESCVECHGENGDGAEGKYDFSNAAELIDFSAQDLFNELRTPEGKHPQNLDALSDDEIWQSLDYIQTLSVELPAPVVSDGVFRGQVLNVTTGEPLSGAPVTLYVLNADGSVVDTVDAVSGEKGAFEFTDLKRDAAFGLGTDYLGVQYFTDEPVFFTPDNAEIDQTLSVYETTDSAENISQSTLHRIIAFVPDAINITDIYIFDNTGDTSFVGALGTDGLPETAKVALPTDATEVSFQGDGARQTDDGYYTDSRPIPPGEGKFSFVVSYFVPTDGKSLEVATPLLQDIGTVNLLLADQGEDFSSDQLQMTGEQAIQGLNYQRWTGASFTAGQDLTMTFGKLNKLDFGQEDGAIPASGFRVSGPDQITLRWGILGAGLLAIAFVIFRVYGPATATSPAASAQKEQLLAVLQELDSMHQAGDLDDAEYHRLKEKNTDALKATLLRNND